MESTERIHPPTPQRRELARQQGRVAKTPDLPLAGMFVAGVLLLMLSGGDLFEALAGYLRGQLSGATHGDAGAAFEPNRATLLRLAVGTAWICGGVFVVALFGHLLQTGFRPQPRRLAPDFSRLDPSASAAHLFSGAATIRQIGLAVKFLAVVGMAAWAVWDQRIRIFSLGGMAPQTAAACVGEIMRDVCLKIGGALLAVSAADYGFARWRHERTLQMTSDELRQEMRNQSGDPAVLRRRRQLRRELPTPALEPAMAEAQLVLVQDRALAVVVQYDPRAESAPIVTAKGRADRARRICDIAERTGIPIVDDPRLTESIARQTPVGAPIRAEHYRAIAGLLATESGRVAAKTA